jgi:hypothetical protein
MHHLIYPAEDTFVTNTINYDDVNFGLDEILRVGTDDVTARFSQDTQTFSYDSASVTGICIQSFTGNVTSGSLLGLATYISGTIASGTGSVSGSGFSGSSMLSGINFSGSIGNFNGTITEFSGSVTGTITGHYTISQSNQVVSTKKYVNRALVKFDLDVISASIASGDISDAEFILQMNVAREQNLPISYSIYAFPISQSWAMGNGYLSDGGSSTGASWNYRNYYSGSVWATVTDPNGLTPIDFLNDSTLYPLLWARGGGTWYTSSISSQSFDYEVGDIDMDVSNIVYAWLSGSIPNEGLILLSDDETRATGSAMALYFFSRDTNTIYQPRLNVGWDDSTWITGSVSTGSVTISTTTASYQGVITTASIVGSSITGSFVGIANYSSSANLSASGVISVVGNSETIADFTIFGQFSGSLSSSDQPTVYGSGSLLQGVLIDGLFSGSNFTSSLDGYDLTWGILSGSITSQLISGSRITSNLPFSVYPNFYVDVSGLYVNGTAFGTFNVSSSVASASFNGIFTTGIFDGARLDAQISGTFFTSSYSWTSSIVVVSSSLDSVEFSQPFVTVIQNLPPTARAGNIIRINVFARPEFPFKNFQRRTQFTQYLTPQYLPTSSYYAIKDNETDQIVIDFDNYTRVSCDANGNFFLLDTTGLPQERYFKLLIKTEQSGSVVTFDKGDIFKIVR